MTTVKKSAVIAFVELLKSIDEEDDVLLLRSSDHCARDAMQAYNDEVHNDHKEMPEDYAAFSDKLAQTFASVQESYLPQVDIPDKASLKVLAKTLVELRKKLLSA